MSQIKDMLIKEAAELRHAAEELEWRQTKRAAADLLVNQGMSAEAAYKILNDLESQASTETI